MKLRLNLNDDDINAIVRRELENVMIDHPKGHTTAEAARHLLWYFSTTKQACKSIKRVRKLRRT